MNKIDIWGIIPIIILILFLILALFVLVNKTNGAEWQNFENADRATQNQILKSLEISDKQAKRKLNKVQRTDKVYHKWIYGGTTIPDRVGYAPVIVVLPEGANYGVSALISADRRYARISPTFTFSSIKDVRTFTFQGPNSGRTTGPVYNNKR